jgi:hypothetical protein
MYPWLQDDESSEPAESADEPVFQSYAQRRAELLQSTSSNGSEKSAFEARGRLESNEAKV